jgi:hypothetical protein
MVVERKIWPEYFNDIRDGKRCFDIRLADFDVDVGDTILIKEWDPLTQQYTGREVKKLVTYLMRTKEMAFWNKDEIEKYGYQIMSLADEKK